MFNKDNNMGSVFVAFAIGGLIGAGLALLIAPQSGPETRAMIMDKGADIKDKTVSKVEDARAQAEKKVDDLTSKAKDKASELSNRGRDMMESKSLA